MLLAGAVGSTIHNTTLFRTQGYGIYTSAPHTRISSALVGASTAGYVSWYGIVIRPSAAYTTVSDSIVGRVLTYDAIIVTAPHCRLVNLLVGVGPTGEAFPIAKVGIYATATAQNISLVNVVQGNAQWDGLRTAAPMTSVRNSSFGLAPQGNQPFAYQAGDNYQCGVWVMPTAVDSTIDNCTIGTSRMQGLLISAPRSTISNTTVGLLSGSGVMTSGSCSVPIQTLAQCSAAAAVLGLSDVTASNDTHTSGSTGDPPWCYVYASGSSRDLRFNRNGLNTGACSASKQCVCDRPRWSFLEGIYVQRTAHHTTLTSITVGYAGRTMVYVEAAHTTIVDAFVGLERASGNPAGGSAGGVVFTATAENASLHSATIGNCRGGDGLQVSSSARLHDIHVGFTALGVSAPVSSNGVYIRSTAVVDVLTNITIGNCEYTGLRVAAPNTRIYDVFVGMTRSGPGERMLLISGHHCCVGPRLTAC